MVRKLLIAGAVSLVVPGSALAAVVPGLPESALACISVETSPPAGLPLSSSLRGVPRSLVLCVRDAKPAPLAIKTFVSAACRAELKKTRFAVRYGGGDYTTFAQCLAYKSRLALSRLGLAQVRGCQGLRGRAERGAASVVGVGQVRFGIYYVSGRC